MAQLHHAYTYTLAMSRIAMYQAVCYFLRWFRPFWATVFGCLVVLAPLPAGAQSTTMPPCPRQDGYFVTAPLPHRLDRTLFLSHIIPLGLWHSNNDGQTWNIILNLSNFAGISAGQPYVVPSWPSPEYHIYFPWSYNVNNGLGPKSSMLWYSDDSGGSWEARNPCTGDCTFDLHLTDASDVLFGIEHSSYTWPSSGIWRTTNGAHSWIEMWNDTEAGWLAVSPGYSQDHTLFASLSGVSPELGSPVIVSMDGGETWQGAGGEDLCNEAAGSVQVSSGFTADHTLFVHQASSLFRSQNAGETWEVVFPSDRPHCQPGVLAPTADSYKLSSNFGQDHTLYMVTTGPNDDQRLLVSGDGGATWDYQSSVSRSTSLLWVLAAAENRGGSETDEAGNALFAGAMAEGTSASSGVRAAAPKSNWTAFLPLIDWSAAQPTARSFTLFINAWNGVDGFSYYRSDDGGVTWACMLLPTVQPPGRTRYLGEGR